MRSAFAPPRRSPPAKGYLAISESSGSYTLKRTGKNKAKAAAAGQDTSRSTYRPAWYSGRSFDRLGATGFASAISASVASATAAAASIPGRSSGSGGGGFSADGRRRRWRW